MVDERQIRCGQIWCCVGIYTLAAVANAATVSGTLRDSAPPQDPIANARVTLFDAPLSFFREQRTASDGSFSFANVPNGTYRLGACAVRFEYLEVEAVVEAQPFEHSFLLGPEVEPGRWDIVGNTLPEFFDTTDIAILTTEGKVFYCHDTVDPILFDPVTGKKMFPTGSPSEQGCMNGTLLGDGRIIMVGGQDGSDPGSFRNAIPWVKTYTPWLNSWQLLPDMQHNAGRWYPGLARLADGSLLVMGGGTAPKAERTDTCERFDLITQSWTYTGSMLNPTEFPPSALLFTGEVLATWWPPQLYDPQTGQWRLTANFNQPNRGWPGHSDHSLVMLSDGRALAIGVRKGPEQNTEMAEIYDPVPETWSFVSNPDLVRFQTEVVQLPDGRILVAGGETEVHPPPVEDVLGIVQWCDLYDPSTDTWRRVADLNWFREYHAVTLLVPDGRVLTTGGTRIKFQVGPTSADIEALVPPYLFRGVRPQIDDVSATDLARAERVYMRISPDTQITSSVLIGTATTTHWVDAGVPRRLELSVRQIDSIVAATLPEGVNVLPLGHYIAFAMVDDIPSVGIIVRVSDRDPAKPGDFDLDGDVDLVDFAAFVDCTNGPGALPVPTPPGTTFECLVAFDSDADVDVDMGDFSVFQNDFTGSE